MDKLTWNSVSKARDDKGDFFTVTFYKGPPVLTHCNIRGEHETKAITDYMACFGGKKPERMFFKGLVDKSSGRMVGTARNVGKNKMGDYGKYIARWLGKEDFESYTGHCFRR
jgi:hypothetical protein